MIFHIRFDENWEKLGYSVLFPISCPSLTPSSMGNNEVRQLGKIGDSDIVQSNGTRKLVVAEELDD